MSQYQDPLEQRSVGSMPFIVAGISVIPLSLMLIQGVIRLAIG